MFLCVDAAADSLSLGLFDESRKCIRYHLNEKISRAADQLLEHLPDFLRGDTEKIVNVIFANGPGSFTGLRIAYATLRGFFADQNIAWFGVSSLLLASLNFPKDQRPACLGLPAGTNRSYCIRWQGDQFSESIESVMPDVLNTPILQVAWHRLFSEMPNAIQPLSHEKPIAYLLDPGIG